MDGVREISMEEMLLDKASVIPINEKEGGGYMSFIPEYGYSIVGDGETVEESLESLKKSIRHFLKRHYFKFKKVKVYDCR